MRTPKTLIRLRILILVFIGRTSEGTFSHVMLHIINFTDTIVVVNNVRKFHVNKMTGYTGFVSISAPHKVGLFGISRSVYTELYLFR